MKNKVFFKEEINMKSPYEYTVHCPKNMNPDKKYPVIFGLHGIGYNENDMLELVENVKEEFILIGIRGNLTYEKGYAYYFLKSYGNPERELFDSSMENMEAFIEEACEQYPIDRDRKYLIGFSQGAILSMSLALVLGESIKGVVAMNGYIPEFVKEEFPLKSIQQTSFLVTQGEKDQIFSLPVGLENYEYLRQHAGSVKYTIYPAGHEVTAEMKCDLVSWIANDAIKEKIGQ
jgi:phospholipase/carboxylesterase